MCIKRTMHRVVLEKAGFQEEGFLREHYVINGCSSK
jgi:RimJ/RimL family protein N-acetyltransferase